MQKYDFLTLYIKGMQNCKVPDPVQAIF